MRTAIRIVMLVMLFLVMSVAARSQGFEGVFGVQATNGGGAYVSPEARVSFEPSYSWKDWGIGGETYVIPTGKADTKDGWTAGARAEVFVKTFDAWAFGAGESFSYTDTSLYHKQATRAYVLLKYKDADIGIDGRFFLPYGDSRNGLMGPEVRVGHRLKGRLGMRLTLSLFGVYPTDAPQLPRSWRATAGGGLTVNVGRQ